MSKTVRQHAICLAIGCIVMAFGVTAFAVPPEEVFQTDLPLNTTSSCCISFNEGITVTELARPVPVVVTWEVFVLNPGPGNIGLMVNGGPCTFYGSGSISNVGGQRMFQWVIFPNDGLEAGSNTFTLCGGGIFGNQFMAFTRRTLAARLSS
jgi:hypothetical protein